MTAPSLCVGMSTYDDFDGVWFTVQSICLFHPEVIRDVSFVVVDNHPEGPAAEPLKALGAYVANYRYVPFRGFRGTAVRDLVFRETDAEVVCCVDSHVLLYPGALAALQLWFAERPDSRDLVQGPIVWDDLRSGATHMEPTWRDGMFGIWGKQSPGDADGEPFEIPMHGLGLFACRRAAWPGLNPRLRGFGGEEGYLHEKFRQRGGRVLCHPAVRWVHRFGRPTGTSYPNVWEDRVRNYVLGWSELGWDLAPAEMHFRDLLGARSDAIWQHARTQAEHPLSAFDGVFCVASDDEACGEHEHPDSVAWRVERVTPAPWPDRELRRMTAWSSALAQAARRGYRSALLLDGPARTIDAAPVKELMADRDGWDVCLLATGDEGGALTGRAVAVNGRAFERLLSDLRDDDAGRTVFMATWGDLDSYLLHRVSDGVLKVTGVVAGVPFAYAGGDRLTLAPGLDAVEHEQGITIRRDSSPRVYDLNHTAAIVLRLCDGTRTVPEAAIEVASILGLAAAPFIEVSACVQQLRQAGVLVEAGGGGVEAGGDVVEAGGVLAEAGGLERDIEHEPTLDTGGDRTSGEGDVDLAEHLRPELHVTAQELERSAVGNGGEQHLAARTLLEDWGEGDRAGCGLVEVRDRHRLHQTADLDPPL